MNKEVVKAMNKKPTMWDVICKWWNKNGYIVMRILLFPLWGIMWGCEKITVYLRNRVEWSEERAAEILSYYIPRCSEWDAEDKAFYFFDNGIGWDMKYIRRKYIKLRDRAFWKKYASWWGGQMREYLINTFELDGFTKEVGDCYNHFTDITFRLNETED